MKSNVINQDLLMDLSSHDSRHKLPLSQQGRWPPHYKNKLELNQTPIGLMETPLSCKGPTQENQRMHWHQQQEQITTPQSNYTQLSTSVRQSTAPKKDEDNVSRGGGGGMSKIFSEKANSSQLNFSQDMGVKQIDGDEMQDLVMSRSDWFQCLKVAYSQLESGVQSEGHREKVIGVDKDQLIAMIELNLNQLPLQTLKEYIGQSVVRKEKWISYGHVIESLKRIETQLVLKNGYEENVIFWDDIIDSLLIATLHNNNRSLVIDSNNISEIYSSEAACSIGAAVNAKNQNLQQISQINIDIGKAQKKEQEEKRKSTQKEALKQGKKLVLKDNSILLDLSKIEQTQSTQSVQDVLQLFVRREQQHNLRGLSLACFQIPHPISQYLNISNMNGLVILNLSSMININLEQELPKINLLNLQFLNISNNSLQQINFSNHNFPKLKEIYANNNRFMTAKSFAKVDSIKLLDLEDNLIEDYEELVCLAFLSNMIVLSLKGNPVSGFMGFEGNMKKILSKLTLLNPDNIKKVSCFENFKELAFGNGLQPFSKTSQNNSESQLSQYNDVPKRTVNITIEKEAQVQKYTIGAPIQTTASQRSTPNKQTVYNVHTKRFFLKNNDSPSQQPGSANKSPSKVALSQKIIANHHQNDTYESQNIHNKLTCPQALPIKNDSLKYFNKLSRKSDQESNRQSNGGTSSSYNVSLETENEQQNKNPLMSQSTYDKREDLSSSKPPRCIKIRPSPSIPTVSSQSQIIHPRVVSRGAQNTSQTLVMDSSSVTETDAGLSTPKYNRRDIQSQHIQPFVPLQNQNIDQEQMNRRGMQENQVKSEVARYYERSISQMNINKIREMTTKEVCKVSDNQIKGNMSPINAMMILQPPQNENRQSISVNKGEKAFSQQTPKQTSKPQNSSKKSNSTVRRRNGSKVTPKSQNDFIINDNHSRHNQNKTQTFSFNKVVNTKHAHPASSRSSQGLLKSSRNRKLNPSALPIENRYAQGMSYEGQTKRSSIDENSSFFKGDSKFSNVNRTQHPITTRDGQFSTPFQNYINNVVDMTSKESERESIRPFRLPPRESPSLYKKHVDKENQQQFMRELNYSQEERMNQLRTTEKKEYNVSTSDNRNFHIDDDEYDQMHNEENINTPRFSDRIKEQNKEHKYQVAMKRITSKRKRQEDKKQLYNSIKGQHRQSLSSTTSNKAIENKHTGRDSSSSMRYNQGSKSHILNDNCSRVSSSNCLKLNIDLRKNR